MPHTSQALAVVAIAVSCVVALMLLSGPLPCSFSLYCDYKDIPAGNVISQIGPVIIDARVIPHNSDPADLPKRADHEQAPSPPHFTRTIVAVGDFHGDGDNAWRTLKMAGVIDMEGGWTGKVDFLVQTGDIIDRGDDTIILFEFMEDLRVQARAKGGTVVSLLGNHEYLNLLGPERNGWAYVTESEKATFGSDAERMARLRSGDIGQWWAAHYQAAARLPLHLSLGEPDTDHDPKKTYPLGDAAIAFVHGGLPPTYPDVVPFPSLINDLGRSTLRKLQTDEYSSLTDAELGLLRKSGPLWYRGWADMTQPEAVVCAQLDDMLKKTGTRRMIMGHTAQLNDKGILSRCDGKILVIDTGISKAFPNGKRSALLIEYTLRLAPGQPEVTDNSAWIELEVVTAIYPQKSRVVLAKSRRRVFGKF